MRNLILILCLCLVAVLYPVNGDKWTVMDHSDCRYQCQTNCEEKFYKQYECINQGGIFPKYAECHCFGYQNQNSLDEDNY